jgi:hypothetical protein
MIAGDVQYRLGFALTSLCRGIPSRYRSFVPQDADDAKKLIEAEGSEAFLIAADLSEGEEACKKIVQSVSIVF